MRKINAPNLPDTNRITDARTEEYARQLNVELENFRLEINRYANKLVVTTQTSDYTVQAEDEVIFVSGATTITLPSAGNSEGRVYYIKNIGSSTVTVATKGTETIDEELTKSLFQYEAIDVVSDNSNWWII